MCEVEHEGRNWRLYVQDMYEFSEKVLTYTEGMDLDMFVADSLTYDATLRNIELIGAAATPYSERSARGTSRDSVAPDNRDAQSSRARVSGAG